jgi:hypothetical protein
MTWGLRTVLTWLLVLALPVQGLAAQRMLFCAPAQHHVVQAQAQHDHSAHMHADHSKADAKPVAPAKASHGKCSACASCCGAMAIVSSPLVFGVNPPAPDYLPTALPSYSGHTPGRLDRPPRSTLA